MIRFIGGKPRAGKTKRAVIEIINVLRTTKLCVVTNAELRLQPWVDGKGKARRGLLRVLVDKYGTTFDAEQRIYRLPEEKVRRFYGVRVRVVEGAQVVSEVPESADGRWHFDGDTYASCCYVIDEAHVFFPGAAVAGSKGLRVSGELLGYGSQAGRCGDLVFLISQVLGNVDKQLRGVAQECWWMTNHVHCQLGPFRQQDKISYRVYSCTPPGAGEVWLAKGTMRYDREDIDSSYDTATGVGVTGNTAADIGRRAKGVPIYWVGAIVVMCMVGAWLLFYSFKASAQSFFAIGTPQKKAGATESGPAPMFSAQQLAVLADMFARSRSSGGVSSGQVRTQEVVRARAEAVAPAVAREVITGYGGRAPQCVVRLESGALVFGRSVEQRGSRVVLDGVEYDFRPGGSLAAESSKRGAK